MGKRETNRTNDTRKILAAIKRLGVRPSNARLAEVTGFSKSKISRLIGMLDLPPEQKFGLEPMDLHKYSIHRQTGAARKSSSGTWMKDRSLWLISKLPDEIGSKLIGLLLDEDQTDLVEGDRGGLIRRIGCTPAQFLRWVDMAVAGGRVIELPQPAGEILPRLRGTGRSLPERASIIGEVEKFSERTSMSEKAPPAFSTQEQRVLLYVSHWEDGPVGYCDRRVAEIAQDLGIAGRTVQKLVGNLVKAGELHRCRYETGHGLPRGQFLSRKPISVQRRHDLTMKVAARRS